MNFRRRREDDIEINVTSLIDVVLLLLIFFMVSTRFVDDSKLKLHLPAASDHPVPAEPAAIEVAIDREGTVAVNGERLAQQDLEGLKAALVAAKGQQTDPMVIISADREADFQRAVDAMDAARLVGLSRVTFPTVARESP
jgi:biopolymer transport protein ExbD